MIIMKNHVYADNAATTKLDKEVFEAMIPWLTEEYGNPSQPYAFSRSVKKALSEARATIAYCINAEPDEIYFTSGGTESNNWVIKGSAFSDPDHKAMITSAFEHHAILHSCFFIERMGYPVAYVEPNSEGTIEPEVLKQIITNRTRLVSVMYANNELGSIQPIKDLCSISHEHGALFHTDAVQAVGHIKVDVKSLEVDFLSASAHKFNGPRGIGFLYARKGTELLPLLDGGSQERKLRAGTENVASIVGMAAALKKNCDCLEENTEHLLLLANELIAQLDDTQIKYKKNGSIGLPGLLSLSFPGFDGEAILHRLDLFGISVSTGSACDSKNTEISHVLKSIRLDEAYAKGTIRISLGKYNSKEDIDEIIKALKKIVR